MTDAERHWLSANNHPRDLMELVESRPLTGSLERRWRLFVCGCARRVVHLAGNPDALNLIITAERYADGEITREAIEGHWRSQDFTAMASDPAALVSLAAFATGFRSGNADTFGIALQAMDHAAHASGDPDTEWAAQAANIKDIFGNPFRPVGVDPSWLTSDVTALARQMYDSRDFGPMPILADALLDAGCECEEILLHCRGVGPHVRGCHVLDLLLGKG